MIFAIRSSIDLCVKLCGVGFLNLSLEDTACFFVYTSSVKIAILQIPTYFFVNVLLVAQIVLESIMYPPLPIAFVSLHSLNVIFILLIVVDVVVMPIFKCLKNFVHLLVLEGLFYVLPYELNIHTTNLLNKLDFLSLFL
jgi:hypothetical protein